MNRKMKVLATAAVFWLMFFSFGGGNAVFAAEQVAVDFGADGLYAYDGKTLTALTSLNPDNVTSWNGKLVGDFGSYGLWLYDGNSWKGLTGWNAENITALGSRLVADFGSYGIWIYDGSSWTGLTGWNPENITAFGSKLAADFGSYGIWLYNGSSWTGLTGWNPEKITAWGDKLAADFGSNGLWLYDTIYWEKVSSLDAENIVAWGDKLAVNFDWHGLWLYDGALWEKLTDSNAENIVVWGDKLIGDFGSNGIYAYNGTSWTKLNNWDAENITVWGDMLFTDFGDNGFYMYNGSWWTQLAQWNLEGFGVVTINATDVDNTDKMMLGDLGKPADYNSLIKSFGNAVRQPQEASFNWKSKGMVTPAKHQGLCGSCWAFASVGALESKIMISGGPQYDLSEQQLIACSGYDCNGGNSTALMFWTDKGPMEKGCTLYKDYDTPYPGIGSKLKCGELNNCATLPYNIKGYYTVDTTNSNEVNASLYEDGPAFFSFYVYSDFSVFWNTYSPGKVYRQSTGFREGSHAVLIIGWDDSRQAWLCKNSWGATAGPNGDGTFWIAYSGHANELDFGMTNFKITNTGPVPTPVNSSTDYSYLLLGLLFLLLL